MDAPSGGSTAPAPQFALLDMFFPGFSVFSGAVEKYFKVDLNLYIPLVIFLGCVTFMWRYFSEYLWEKLEAYFMSTVDIRTDDEIYNMLMAWVAQQKFAKGARRFVVNTNLNSRAWYLWRWDDDDDDGPEDGDDSSASHGKKKKQLAYTPTFGSHFFVSSFRTQF
ncbi:putative mitochondrial chaperone bcs1 [Diaporthe ampelina]|uniref:Putative mitochondrial chaperone bcs1 n=1 Tax=Diaporthe ampelina TaxID=1214573 RepID=A0A0G2FKN0_9PEZI|nr:putative mitochondrial chaperone bcs1 [Diaporthe ampelina]